MNKTMDNVIKKIKPKKKEKNKAFESFWERNQMSNGYLLKKRIGTILLKFIRAITLFGLCFLILQPILNKLSVSFMEETDLYDATVVSIPRNWSTVNYRIVSMLMNYKTSLLNTLWVSLVVAVVQIASCILVGYGFARYKFPFKNLLFGCVIMSIIIPPQVILTPLYINFRYFDLFGIITLIKGSSVNLLNSIWPYIMLCAGCMGLKSGLYIFMLRQYFRGIPKELEEAAYVDGCGKLRTFITIMLPDAKPMITSCFLFAYVWQWTDSFYSSLFLRKFRLLAQSVGSIADGFSQYVSRISNGVERATEAYTQTMISTGMLMVIAPLLIIYLVAQKGFVESLAQTGIKM